MRRLPTDRRLDRFEAVAISLVASVTLLLVGWTVLGGSPHAQSATTADSLGGMSGMPGMSGASTAGGALFDPPSSSAPSSVGIALLPGMRPLLDPHDAYAADRPGALSAVDAHDPPRVYVPNSKSDTVTVIDPRTYKVLGTYKVGHEPQHVVPSWDLRTLWVNDDLGNNLVPIDPATGRFGRPVYVHDPYNLYFTPDGKYAVVMASAD
ncbi:MAG: YncE family protein, partial [Actinomycetes bacterium]